MQRWSRTLFYDKAIVWELSIYVFVEQMIGGAVGRVDLSKSNELTN